MACASSSAFDHWSLAIRSQSLWWSRSVLSFAFSSNNASMRVAIASISFSVWYSAVACSISCEVKWVQYMSYLLWLMTQCATNAGYDVGVISECSKCDMWLEVIVKCQPLRAIGSQLGWEIAMLGNTNVNNVPRQCFTEKNGSHFVKLVGSEVLVSHWFIRIGTKWKMTDLISSQLESVAIKGLERNRGWRYNYFGGHMFWAFLAYTSYRNMLTGNYLCHLFGVNNDYVDRAWPVEDFNAFRGSLYCPWFVK